MLRRRSAQAAAKGNSFALPGGQSQNRSLRHVLIYGPPAAGKLTVARLLAERYGMVLLDNHLTFDVAVRVLELGTPQFWKLVESLRRILFEATATAGKHSVSTLVFGHPADRAYVARVGEIAARCGVELSCVQLRPPPAVLHQRVSSESRLATPKIHDDETLRSVLASHDLYTPIEQTDLSIDNSEVSPEEVVDRIAAHLRL